MTIDLLPLAVATGTAAPAGADAKLADAAKQFEAMLLGEMLKPLHFGAGVDEGAEEGPGGAADTIRGLGTDALAKALAGSGGFGVARQIVKQVTAEHKAQAARERKDKVT